MLLSAYTILVRAKLTCVYRFVQHVCTSKCIKGCPAHLCEKVGQKI